MVKEKEKKLEQELNVLWKKWHLNVFILAKAPYGYIRNKETGHLEVEPIEAEVVKEIFELCKQGNSTRSISTIMKDNNAYLKLLEMF